MRDQLFEEARRVRPERAAGASVDDVLRRLRDEGFGLVESVGVLRFAESISNTSAKQLVMSSPVWADRRQRWQDTREAAAQALRRAP